MIERFEKEKTNICIYKWNNLQNNVKGEHMKSYRILVKPVVRYDTGTLAYKR
jgi:hypothetical protein